MRDELPPGQLFDPGRFVADLVSELARRAGPLYPTQAFHEALRIATENDERRSRIARNKELDAGWIARHQVVNGWAFGGTTATRRQPPMIAESYWDAQSNRPDSGDGVAEHYRFRRQQDHELLVQKAAHMRQRRSAAAVGTSGSVQ